MNARKSCSSIRAMGRSLIPLPPLHTRSVSTRPDPVLCLRRIVGRVPHAQGCPRPDCARQREAIIRAKRTAASDLATATGRRHSGRDTAAHGQAIRSVGTLVGRSPLPATPTCGSPGRRLDGGIWPRRLPTRCSGSHAMKSARRQVGARHVARMRGILRASSQRERGSTTRVLVPSWRLRAAGGPTAQFR